MFLRTLNLAVISEFPPTPSLQLYCNILCFRYYKSDWETTEMMVYNQKCSRILFKWVKKFSSSEKSQKKVLAMVCKILRIYEERSLGTPILFKIFLSSKIYYNTNFQFLSKIPPNPTPISSSLSITVLRFFVNIQF